MGRIASRVCRISRGETELQRYVCTLQAAVDDLSARVHAAGSEERLYTVDVETTNGCPEAQCRSSAFSIKAATDLSVCLAAGSRSNLLKLRAPYHED